MSIHRLSGFRFFLIFVLLSVSTPIPLGQVQASSHRNVDRSAHQSVEQQGDLSMREPLGKSSERAPFPGSGPVKNDAGGGALTQATCTDPVTCNPVFAITSLWRCNSNECTSGDWVGGVINWPSWSAYDHNARTGDNSRTVYSLAGEKLYPYMGSWADGCQVTVVSGRVLIIEWQRGTDVWRATELYPGDSYTIDLIGPENNAMIEAPDGHRDFSVSLSNCNPQNIYEVPPTPTPVDTATPSPTPEPTDIATATATFTQTPPVTPSATATATSTFTATPTATDVATDVPMASFRDVQTSYWAWSYIESLYGAGVTSGCGSGNFCPTATVTREQMSVFMLRAKHGPGYLPPSPVGAFTDVPVGHWAAPWIEQAAKEGIITACKPSTRMFCPTTPVTRDYMAVFLLKARYGSGYIPPQATGVFADVPASHWAAAWIEKLAADGITAGCRVTPRKYCPSSTITRDQMAVFLVRNFNLP